ncbi:hypothetical protein DV736_g92, partial [Chaetothyriales sp. CBS 134916]
MNDDIPDHVLDSALSTLPFVAVPETFNTRETLVIQHIFAKGCMNIAGHASLKTDADPWDGGSRRYSKQYREILDIYKNAFQEVFRHLHDRPGAPILFNCTAGKDHTSVLATLILSLTGVPDEDIAFDYSLTRVGIEPQKEFLKGVIKRWKPTWTTPDN